MNLTDRLKKLIEFKTVTGNDKELRHAYAWVCEELKSLPVHIKRVHDAGFESLVITTRRTKRPKLMLAAHMDVVPGSESIFKPTIKNSKLYGRGAYDMKFALACYIELFKEIGKDLSLYDMGIVITSDEEIGGAHGTRFLIKKGFAATCCVLPDSGDKNELIVSAKGGLQFKIFSQGISAHASRPWEGDSAIKKLMAFLDELECLFNSTFRTKKNPRHCCSMNIGLISGGEKANSIPASAEAVLDFRLFTEAEKNKLRRIIKKLSKKRAGVTVQETLDVATFSVDVNIREIQSFREIYKKMTRCSLVPSLAHGATDGRFFSEAGIPTIILRPDGGGHHSENEWISIKSLERFYDTLKAFVIANAKSL